MGDFASGEEAPHGHDARNYIIRPPTLLTVTIGGKNVDFRKIY